MDRKEIHEAPQILNFGQKNTGPILQSGMTLAIEPIIVAGNEDNFTASDNWTIITKDGSLSAHFEHTIVVLDHGAEVLT